MNPLKSTYFTLAGYVRRRQWRRLLGLLGWWILAMGAAVSLGYFVEPLPLKLVAVAFYIGASVLIYHKFYPVDPFE